MPVLSFLKTRQMQLLKARQMGLYFQQYKELPEVKKCPIDSADIQRTCECFHQLFEEYRQLDNSPRDYDPREGHLLLAEDVEYWGPSQVSYHKNGEERRISKFIMNDELSCHGLLEEHQIWHHEKFHILTIHPKVGNCDVEARTLNRLEPEVAHQQRVTLKYHP